jgi:hypothetical protein
MAAITVAGCIAGLSSMGRSASGTPSAASISIDAGDSASCSMERLLDLPPQSIGLACDDPGRWLDYDSSPVSCRELIAGQARTAFGSEVPFP